MRASNVPQTLKKEPNTNVGLEKISRTYHVGQFRGIFSHLCGLAWSAPSTLNQESTTKMADNQRGTAKRKV